MWADTPTLRLIAFSCLIGFVVFCLSYSTLVWRRRNRSNNSDANLLQRYRGWFVSSVVLGMLLMAIATAVREAVSSDATVTTENFYVARSGEEMYATEVAKEGPINKGDLLVKFSSPKISAELEEAQHKLKRMEAEYKSLPFQPLPLDSELIRRHQNAEAAKRGLSDSQNVVLTSLEAAVRELRQQIDAKQETLTKTIGEIEVNTKELRQAEDQLRIAQSQLDRELTLENRGSLLSSEIDQRRKEVSMNTAELAKQQSRKSNLAGLRAQLESMLKELRTLEKSQTEKLQGEHSRVQKELAKAQVESSEFAAKLEQDTLRATKVRASEIEQMASKVNEAKAAMTGLLQRLERRAPFAGRVFYAHPSGASTPANTPIVVLGPEDGFRTRVRLLATQLDALKSATDVTLDVGEGQLSRVFPAKFRQAFDLPAEPNFVIAELDTNPPAEAVKVMAEETRMKARLSWRFPIWTFWPFKLGIGFVIVGLIGYFLGNVKAAEATTTAVPVTASPKPVTTTVTTDPVKPATTSTFIPVTSVVTPTPKPAVTEQRRVIVPATMIGGAVPPITTKDAIIISDLQPKSTANDETVITAIEPEKTVMVHVKPEADTKLLPQIRDLVKQDPIVVGPSESSKLLEILAIRLREAIHREFLEVDVVESAEWAFANHGQRAIRVFRQVFREDNRYVPHMRTLLERLEKPIQIGNTAAIQQQHDLVKRTGKILEAIGARFLSPVSVA